MKIIVIGGGAAGFFGAITCAESFPGHEATILEKSRHVLSKVRISGGGRCNVTHACFNNRQLSGYYPRGNREMPGLLQQFDAAHTVEWFRQRGVALKTEPDGRMFPVTDNSETIVDCLLTAARKAGVQIRTSAGVKAVEVITQPEGPAFQLRLLDGSELTGDRLLIATGGNPQLQAYEWLSGVSTSATPHRLQSPVPSLFTFHTPDSPLLDLAGVSVPHAVVTVRENKLRQEGPLLITHWGFSGPAILKLSAWGARELHDLGYQFTLLVNWLPQYHEEALRQKLTELREVHKKKTIAANPFFELPLRLWKRLVTQSGIAEDLRWADLPNKLMNRWIELLLRSSFTVTGKSTFKDEFVTCGGIALSEINLQTMESKRCPGLYFAGEVLDIDGVTGGFNFQGAWTTGFIAGKNMGHPRPVEQTA